MDVNASATDSNPEAGDFVAFTSLMGEKPE